MRFRARLFRALLLITSLAAVVAGSTNVGNPLNRYGEWWPQDNSNYLTWNKGPPNWGFQLSPPTHSGSYVSTQFNYAGLCPEVLDTNSYENCMFCDLQEPFCRGPYWSANYTPNAVGLFPSWPTLSEVRNGWIFGPGKPFRATFFAYFFNNEATNSKGLPARYVAIRFRAWVNNSMDSVVQMYWQMRCMLTKGWMVMELGDFTTPSLSSEMPIWEFTPLFFTAAVPYEENHYLEKGMLCVIFTTATCLDDDNSENCDAVGVSDLQVMLSVDPIPTPMPVSPSPTATQPTPPPPRTFGLPAAY